MAAPVCHLRSFPVPPSFENGNAGAFSFASAVDFRQTMGQLMLLHQLDGGWSESDISVEMSRKSLRVTVGGQPLQALCGDFMHDVWRSHSWWVYEERDRTLVVHVFKRELRAWKNPWITTALVTFKRQGFPWTRQMEKHGSGHNDASHGTIFEDVPEEAELTSLPPGRPEPDEGEPWAVGGFEPRGAPEGASYSPLICGGAFAPRSMRYRYAPDALCIGITASQDDRDVFIQVHFDRESFESIKRRIPVEALLAADVTEDSICIFLQGDKQNPILLGDLWGKCVVDRVSWRLVSAEALRSQQQDPSRYSPALELKLRKQVANGAEMVEGQDGIPRPGRWKQVFRDCWHHRLLSFGTEPETGPSRVRVPEGSKVYLRSGYDLKDPDFWGHVNQYVKETLKRTGYLAPPQALLRTEQPVA